MDHARRPAPGELERRRRGNHGSEAAGNHSGSRLRRSRRGRADRPAADRIARAVEDREDLSARSRRRAASSSFSGSRIWLRCASSRCVVLPIAWTRRLARTTARSGHPSPGSRAIGSWSRSLPTRRRSSWCGSASASRMRWMLNGWSSRWKRRPCSGSGEGAQPPGRCPAAGGVAGCRDGHARRSVRRCRAPRICRIAQCHSHRGRRAEASWMAASVPAVDGDRADEGAPRLRCVFHRRPGAVRSRCGEIVRASRIRTLNSVVPLRGRIADFDCVHGARRNHVPLFLVDRSRHGVSARHHGRRLAPGPRSGGDGRRRQYRGLRLPVRATALQLGGHQFQVCRDLRRDARGRLDHRESRGQRTGADSRGRRPGTPHVVAVRDEP